MNKNQQTFGTQIQPQDGKRTNQQDTIKIVEKSMKYQGKI